MYSTMPFLYLPLIIMVQWNMTLWSLHNKNTIVLEGPWGHEGPMFHRAMMIERVVACSSNALTWNHHLHTPNAAPHTADTSAMLTPAARGKTPTISTWDLCQQNGLKNCSHVSMALRLSMGSIQWLHEFQRTAAPRFGRFGEITSIKIMYPRTRNNDRTLCSGSAGKICKTHWPAKRSKG